MLIEQPNPWEKILNGHSNEKGFQKLSKKWTVVISFNYIFQFNKAKYGILAR